MTFTNEQVTAAIKAVVAEEGRAHVYEAQRNTPHKRATKLSYSYDDCIVGCVIRKLDPELHAEVLEFEAVKKTSFPFGSAWTLPNDVYDAFTHEQITALREAQAQQDGGLNWGEALSAYTEAIGASE